MKLIGLLACAAALLSAAPLQDVRTVYIFPMKSALDQYLASELTQQHLFQVVADPKAADAVLTDRIGPAFEQMFEQRVLGEKLKGGEQPIHSSFGGKGALFLVNKSKQVVWSTFDSPKDSTAKQLEKAARRSVDRLRKTMYPNASSASPDGRS